MNNFISHKITSYGYNFIKIDNNKKFFGNILLSSSGKIQEINNLIPKIQNLTPIILKKLLQNDVNSKDILLIGCGNSYCIPLPFIQDIAKEENYYLEWMISKSAIHAYNLLIEDYRHVLALIFWY